jgi:MinD-like ATPase involved in chromosome partitioning or flagellar assembly
VSLPVCTAVTDPTWEADLVTTLSRTDDNVHVVRRCVDLADLLATAAAGLARAVVLSADLRRLDREAVTRLSVAGVAVVGLVAPGDTDAERRLRQLGVAHVVTTDAAATAVSAAVVAAVGTGGRDLNGSANGFDLGDPLAALNGHAQIAPDAPADVPAGGGSVVTVWGPTGAPGRSSVALGIAAELALLGVPTLLVDADVYGGASAQLLGLLDDAPGLAAACRLANNGSLDLAALAELAVVARPGLRVLTGIARADRWPELRPSGLDAVLGLARSLAAVTVVDAGFCLERDEELSYDTVAPRRNGATLAAIAGADTVLAVAAADPVALQRFVRGLTELAEAVPGVTPTTVVNRVRPGAVGGGDAEAEIAAALERFAGVHDIRFVPDDRDAFDRAAASGRTLAEAAPTSPARLALQSIGAGLAGRPAPRPRRRLFSRR